MGYRIYTFALLLITWVVLSGQFDAFHLTLGVLSCGLVVWMSSGVLFHKHDPSAVQRIRETLKLFVYLAWMIWQIFLANIVILRLALVPGAIREVDPSIVHFKTRLKSDFAKFLLANSITLTPGTVTIKIIGDDFYVHAINDKAAEGLDGEMERRIARIYQCEQEARSDETQQKGEG